MASETRPSAFEQILTDFRNGLTRDGFEQEDYVLFRQVTRDSLLNDLNELQNELQRQRRGRNLARLQPIIEAMDQLGKVVEVFVNAQNFVAYIWGPMMFIIQIAGAYSGAFNDLLDMYERIGDSFHGLTQSEELFRTNPHMLLLLILMYKDIFEFHRQAIKYFRQPLLKQLFDATWSTYKTRFDPIVKRIQGHGDLIHREATLKQIRRFQQDRDQREAERELQKDNEQNQRLRVLYDWLSSPNVENDQWHFSKIRKEYPETGRWLLNVPVFKKWFDPKFHSIPALLWITGMPGAGKTILASLVIEAARALPSPSTVLFFYCKNGDKERDNFDSIGRTFLVHLLNSNKDILLPYYYSYFSTSTEITLRTPAPLEDLLRTGIMNCRNVYIILDGIDECDRKERTRITTFFRGLVEGSSSSQSDRIRCLFISQDDGIARKDFFGIPSLKIESQHNGADIETFCKTSAQVVAKKFDLDDGERSLIAQKVYLRANGMFLLASQIWSNMINSTSLENLELELEDDNLPQKLVQAYTRIITPLLIKASQQEKEASQKLLTWLVCATRPLQWHEIQAAKSIDLETQSVDLKRYRFRKTPKDLCGSLVEVGQDGTVDFVHSTAKTFLISELYVKQQIGDLQMAVLCLSYWNMPGLSGRETYERLKERVPSGYFAFLDYSISHWTHHLLAGLKNDALKHENVFKDLLKCLGQFLEVHFRQPKTIDNFQISQRTVQRLKPFSDFAFYSDLQVVVTSVHEQPNFHNGMQDSEIALDVKDIAMYIRDILEEAYVELADEGKADFEMIYGKNMFKCSELSCHAFHNGFATATERKRHLDKHDSPLRCSVSGCPQEYVDFSTHEDLERHIARTHTVQLVEQVGTTSDAVPESTTSRPSAENVEPTIASEKDSIFTHQDSVLAKEEDSLTSISADASARRDFINHAPESLANSSKNQQDEIESVFSDELDIGSEASTSRTETEMHAILLIAFYLARIDELVFLCKEVLQAMSQERFSNNLRRILKSYCIRLDKESCNKKEEITVYFLRKRTNRTSIAQKIIQIVQDDGHRNRDDELSKELPDSKKNVSTWLAKSAVHESSDSSGWVGKLTEGDNGEGIDNNDCESDDSESSSTSKSSSTETEFRDIKSLEGFLRRGQPFQNLLVDLRILRLSRPLREIINTVPKQLISFNDNNDTSFRNRTQICLEGYTGCGWDWWPMNPPLQTIEPENSRLLWTLYGRRLQMEITRGQADLLREIINQADDHPLQCYCCLPRPPLVTWSTVLSRVKGLTSPGHYHANNRPAQSASGRPSGAAQRYTPADLTSNATLNTSTQAHMVQRAPNFVEGAGETTDAPRCLVGADSELPECIQSLNVMFAVQGWRWSLELEEIVVANSPSDSKFFQNLRDIHRYHRFRLSTLFSPFRFGNCRFVQFEKMQPNRIISNSEPALPDHHGRGAEYEYEPRPPGAKLPLINQQQFAILLNECSDECWWSILQWHDCIRLSPKSSFLKRIPKRNNPISLLHDESEVTAFGIEADYILSFRYLAFYHIIPIFVAFSFWTYWLVMHPGDLQNASVPIFTVLALAGTFWVLVGKRAGIS